MIVQQIEQVFECLQLEPTEIILSRNHLSQDRLLVVEHNAGSELLNQVYSYHASKSISNHFHFFELRKTLANFNQLLCVDVSMPSCFNFVDDMRVLLSLEEAA